MKLSNFKLLRTVKHLNNQELKHLFSRNQKAILSNIKQQSTDALLIQNGKEMDEKYHQIKTNISFK